ncbi:MAG: bifunctional methylenetetrahydrofolate dehydrogenase/methenyltetrahydrofolate cyclohydrolase FolD [Clostridiaceae bacterium]|nr:bifunctional methylenetetrahydrofolate dehydrogenase/methenyltetrahydrofolate cyclohydrolase FolD [Clostridiaceae bacterium]
MAIIMDGKELSKKIRAEIKEEVEKLNKKNIFPKLAVIMVGNDLASKVYVKSKNKACKEVGIEYEEFLLDENIKMEELLEVIEKLNSRDDIHGILLQSPIPNQLDIYTAFETIDFRKDVDGFNPINIGRLALKRYTFISCTPYGVMKLFEQYKINLKGANVVILGRSNIVGKPLSQCLLNEDATVTICHSKTKNIEEITKNADIVISAIGKPRFVKENMIKKGAVVIDVGINRLEEGLVGDVDFEKVKEKASYITPVPGGVGPMTIAMLLHNVVIATKYIEKDKM